MRLRLKNTTAPFPGGWSVVVPETGHTIAGGNRTELIERVHRHLHERGLPVTPEISEVVDDWIATRVAKTQPQMVEPLPCYQHVTASLGTAAVVGIVTARRRWSLAEVARFTLSMGELLLGRGKPVSMEEAERRAGICAGCPANVEAEPCWVCAAVKQQALRLARGKTSKDSQLKVCNYCGCFNQVHIWLPLEILQRHVSDELNAALPGHCWKKQL